MQHAATGVDQVQVYYAVITRASLMRLPCPGPVKSTEMNHSGNSACCITHAQPPIYWKPIDCDWLALYLGLDGECSYHQALRAEEEAHKRRHGSLLVVEHAFNPSTRMAEAGGSL